jgi:hypothetical protein
MNTLIQILLLGKNRVKGFLLVALLVSLGTATTLIEPWIYRAIIDDIAGVFVQSESFIKVEGIISSTGSSLEHLEGSARRFFHAPLKPEQPGPKHRILIEQDGKPEDLIKAEGYFKQMMMSGNAPND